jgi:hypothetical protein
MAPGSAGLFVPSNYWQWFPKWIDGNPPYTNFSHLVTVFDAYWYSVLELEVLTEYDDPAQAAIVRINGTQIGTIEPRPVSRYQDLQPVSLHFGNGAFLGFAPYNGPQTLTIDPVVQGDPTTALIVGKWRLFYNHV